MYRSLLIICTLSLAGALAAQEHDGGQRRGPGGFGPMRSPAMRVLDADGDGVISAAEMQQAASRFAKLDVNHDGRLTEEEMRPAFGGGARAPREMGRGPGGPGTGNGGGNPEDMVAMLMQFDRNGDGVLQKSEVPERMQGIFARGDSNQDGVLTREELSQVVAKQQQQQQQQSNMHREGPGGGGNGERRPQMGGRGGMGMGMGMMRFDPIMRALDTNGDGEISEAEWNAAPQALAKLDRNGDGQLTADELRPERRSPDSNDR